MPNNDTRWLTVAWDGKAPKLKAMPLEPVRLRPRPADEQPYVWVGLRFNKDPDAGFRGVRVTMTVQLDDDEQPSLTAQELCQVPPPAGEPAPVIDWLWYYDQAADGMRIVPGRDHRHHRPAHPLRHAPVHRPPRDRPDPQRPLGQPPRRADAQPGRGLPDARPKPPDPSPLRDRHAHRRGLCPGSPLGHLRHERAVGERPAAGAAPARPAVRSAGRANGWLRIQLAPPEPGVPAPSDPALAWDAPRRDGEPIPARGDLQDQLVQSPPGRFLRLRLTLRSNGRGTPSLRSARILYPRVSYLDLLPRIFRRDPDGSRFLERFLALFERVITGIEDRYEAFSRQLNFAAAPPDVLDWLTCLIDLSFDPSWPVERRRALVAEAMELYRSRGTVRGIERYIQIYTGRRALIEESYRWRPAQPAFLGGAGAVLGCTFALTGCAPHETPQAVLDRLHAHRFTVFVDLDDACDVEATLAVVGRIVEANKPAHTVHTVRPVYPEARVELQSTVGFDLVLGGREAPRTGLGGGPTPGAGAGVLGVDSVLGQHRPGYARPIEPGL